MSTVIHTQAEANRIIPGLLRSGAREICVTPREAIDLNSIWPGGMPPSSDGPYVLGFDQITIAGDDQPIHPDWVRSLRDQCVAAGVKFVFEGWGEWLPYERDQPPFWRSMRGCMVDGHILPDLSEHEPVNGWWWPCDPAHLDVLYRRVGRDRSGRLLDGRTWE